MTDSNEELRAALADRYPIERELGHGGMATVYLARDLRHGRQVALKVLHPALAIGLGSERFLREVRIAAGLQHPHILPLHDSGEAAGELYYIMPYVEGETLRERLERDGRLPVDEALRIAREVLDALGHAHRHGVVHRDIKPENILLSEGHALVADFGIAKAVAVAGEGRLTETGLAMGTPRYMSPEQIGAGPVDARTDLYALGCVLFEMLDGTPPFTGPTTQVIFAQHVRDPVPSLRERRPEVPAQVERAVARSLAKAPGDRFAYAAEFAAAMGDSTPRSVPRRRYSAKAKLALGFLLVLGVALGLRIVLRRSPNAQALDPNLVVIAPFDARSPSLQRLGEALADYLSRNLDGAGAIHTVPPSMYMRRWHGPADPVLAGALARSTGAGLVLYGSASSLGGDSVLVRGVLGPGAGRDAPVEFEIKGDTMRFDALADSIALAVLRTMGRGKPIGVLRRQPLGGVPLPALKAFLRGEQLYRRGLWDSAIVQYDRAVTLDSSFAMAWSKLGDAAGWGTPLSANFDPAAAVFRAASLNHGLGLRDSLGIVLDSLLCVDYSSTSYEARRRVFAGLENATHLFAGDPEIWYMLGEARSHIGQWAYNSTTDALEAFDRAITLDSGFTPAYEHVIQEAMQLGDPERALAYARAAIRYGAGDNVAGPIQLTALLLQSERAVSPQARALEENATAVMLFRAAQEHLAAWPDSNETAVRLLRRLLSGRASFEGGDFLRDSSLRRNLLASGLARRGHLREAVDLCPASEQFLSHCYDDLALFGAIPARAAAAGYARLFGSTRWDAKDEGTVGHAIAWWFSIGDTASLKRLGQRNAADQSPGVQVRRFRVATEVEAYLSLLRGDSALALRRLSSIPDSAYFGVQGYLDAFVRARLLATAHRANEAATVLDYWAPESDGPFVGLVNLERGRVAEALNDRARAIQAYQYVVDLWRHADPQLDGYVAEAREGLLRLAGPR